MNHNENIMQSEIARLKRARFLFSLYGVTIKNKLSTSTSS